MNPRPVLRASCLALLTFVAACGTGDSALVAVRLFDRLPAPVVEAAPSATEAAWFAEHVLTESELASFRALPWKGVPVDLAARLDGAERVPGGLALGPETGAWLGVVAVPPSTALCFEARILGTGLGAVGDSAKLGAIEFATRPTDDELANFPKHMLSAHFGQPVQADTDATNPLLLFTQERTHFLVLLLLLSGENKNPDLGASFLDLRLRAATPADRLAAVLDAPGAPNGRLLHFTVAMTQRRALLLAAGESLALPLDGAMVGDSIDLSLGLVPQQADPLRPEFGTKLDFTVSLADAGGAELELAVRPLRAAHATKERWLDVSLVLPAKASGAWKPPLALVVRAASDAARDRTPLGLVAEPRLVPVALAPSAPTRRARRPNVIVISIDTLRADRMSLFGNGRPTTPAIDALAQRSLVFEQAWSNGAYTLPSHMSLFTGQVPSLHGVQDSAHQRNPARSPLLAERLAARGYTTVAFTGGGFVDPSFGFGDGFDSYGSLDPMVNTESVRLAKDLESIPGIDMQLLEEFDMGHVEAWLEGHRREEFFLFLHTYAVHQFDPPQRSLDEIGLGEELAGGLATHPEALKLLFNMGVGGSFQDFKDLHGLYDASVRQADEGVGRLLAKLEELDLLEDSLIVLTSDHGKELGEHGAVGHGHALFEEMVHVPLVLFLGKRAHLERGDFAPGRSAAPASLVDMVPTILEALDLAPGPAQSGQSLLHPLPDREVLSEVQNLAVKFALRRGPAKTIWSPLGLDTFLPNTIEEESFDLASDPLEMHPLPPDTARVRHVREVFEAIEARARELGGHAGADASIDRGLRARLEALGYVEDMRRAGD